MSYGTHFFQDLVEADITVASVFPDDPEGFFDESFVLKSENLLAAMAPELKDCEDVVHVICIPAARDGNLLHVYMDASSRKGMGVIGPRLNGAPGGQGPEAATHIRNLESDV